MRITLCHGLHLTQSLLLDIPSRSTCCAPSPSRHKECSHFSLPTYWRRVTAQTLTGLDTSGSVVHFSMNFVGQMSTRRSTTSSKTNTPSWFRSPHFYLHLRGSNPSKSLGPRRSSSIHTFFGFLCRHSQESGIPFCGIL